MAEKLTIRDIARLAGVSKATVSRVLNNKPDVDRETRERILRLMAEHSFVPSIAASGLAGGKTRLIGVLVPALTWPQIPDIMRGIAEVIEQTSYELVLYSIKTRNHERDRGDVIDRILGTRLTAGLLAIFPGQTANHLPQLYDQNFPVVMVDDQGPPPEELPWVSADNRMGGYLATRHLIQLGHRRIAHIQGPLRHRVSHDRLRGYRDALEEAGIPFDPTLVAEGDFMPPGGRACAKQFFALAERPSAIFAANDLMAYGAMGAAEEQGLRIPDDLALVGFDDIPSSAHMQPALTTIRQPFYEMGLCAFELLLSLVEAPPERAGFAFNAPLTFNHLEIDGRRPEIPVIEEMHHPTRIRLATNLVVRASCGASRQLSLSE